MWVVDSEDFTSCYSLFRLPEAWHPYMCFGRAVLFKGPPGKEVYPAMAVVPMGWLNAVSIVQSVVRSLVFIESQIPESSEVSKLKAMPQVDDMSVIYLGSHNELRLMDRHCGEVLQGDASPRHERFLQMCRSKSLPQ